MSKLVGYNVTLEIKEPNAQSFYRDCYLAAGQCEFKEDGDAIGDGHLSDDQIYFYLEGKEPQIGMDIGDGLVKEEILSLSEVHA